MGCRTKIYKSWYGAFFGQEFFDFLWFLIGYTAKICIDLRPDAGHLRARSLRFFMVHHKSHNTNLEILVWSIFSGKEYLIFPARSTGPVLLA